MFLLLDLIGSLLWIALCVGLGYAIGQSAVDVAKAHLALRLYLARLIVVVFVRQSMWRRALALPPGVGGRVRQPLTIVPRTAPSSIVPARPRSVTVSPSARKPVPASSRQPWLPGSVPEIVPEANRSPGRTAAPLTVACASCCGNVQYRRRALPRVIRLAVHLDLELDVERPVAARCADSRPARGSCSRAGTR